MDEIIEVENIVTRECRRVIHLMSNRELTGEEVASFGVPADGVMMQAAQEAGVHHLRAEWPYRGLLDMQCEGWPKAKRLAVCSFAGCVSVTDALMQATRIFEDAFDCRPTHGFVRIPLPGDEALLEVGPLMVFDAEWMLEKCAAVVGGW